MNTKEKRIAERYIPNGYVEAHKDENIHVWFGDNSKTAKELNFTEIQYYAIAYKAKAGKSYAHIRFRDEARRQEWLNQQIDSFKAYKARIEERKAQRHQKHNVKIGDIFYSSWGYDQTNINFYQVISTTDRMVEVQEIAGAREYEGDMHGNTTAVKDAFIANTELGQRYPEQFKPFKRVVDMSGEKPSIKIEAWGQWAWLDDGRSHGFSTWA